MCEYKIQELKILPKLLNPKKRRQCIHHIIIQTPPTPPMTTPLFFSNSKSLIFQVFCYIYTHKIPFTMAALRVISVASTSTSFHCYPSVFTKFKSSPTWAISFSVTPLLCSRRAKRMAHSIARATLGLTHPNQIEAHKVCNFSFLFIKI